MTNQEIRKAKRQKIHRNLTIIIFLLIILVALTLCAIGNQYSDEIRDTDILNKLNDIDVEIAPSEEIESSTFTITHYCSCSKCCGKSDGITATGTHATEGRTIAVDPNIL